MSNRFPTTPSWALLGAGGRAFLDLWGLFQINAPAAWQISQGEGIVVAVVDSGLDIEHPDIAANVWVNEGEIPGNGIDDDGNGFVDDVYGWDFTHCVQTDTNQGTCPEPKDPGPDVSDTVGHGTHVTGLIAAVGNNGIGMIGVAPRAKIMVVKGIDGSGSGTSADLAAALVYAAENGARVINASWSGPPSKTIEAAVQYVTETFDAVVVASVDNSDVPLERGEDPANLPSVVAVGATTETDQHAPFSSFGGPLDLTAPGGGGTEPAGIMRPDRSILSLLAAGSDFGILCQELSDAEVCSQAPWVVDGEYVRESGTSMSTAFVSGVAALIRSAHPDLTRRQVRQVLLETAKDLGPAGWDPDFGYGRVDAAAAVAVDTIPVAQITVPENRQKIWERDFPFAVKGTANGGGSAMRSWELRIQEEGATGQSTLVAQGTDPITGDTLGTLSLDKPITLVPGHRFVLELIVEDEGGNQATDTKVFLVPNPRYAIVPIPDPLTRVGGNITLSSDGGKLALVRVDRLQRDGAIVWLYDADKIR